MDPQSTPNPNSISGVVQTLVKEPLYWLLAAVPIAGVLKFMQPPADQAMESSLPLWLFVVACVAVIPLAGLMGRATENLAETMGPSIGGLLNATFGNAAELIIALIAISRGPEFHGLVKASLTGSIIGNILLVLGLALLAGGVYEKRLTFNASAAGMGSTLLAIAAIGLLIPTLYQISVAAHPHVGGPKVVAEADHATSKDHAPNKTAESEPKSKPEPKPEPAVEDQSDQAAYASLSKAIAVILAITYVLSLWFTLGTHRHLFGGGKEKGEGDAEHAASAEHPPHEHHEPEWNRKTSITMLVLATIGVAVISEFLISSVEIACQQLGMTHVFVGVIEVAVIGNAAEHSTAVLVAMKNKMDLAINIAVGSSIQIALFVAPVLVFASVLASMV
ncbi:MAG: hypothetical protein N2C14_09040, partial [Planctomycetales bacterium]